MTGQRLGPKNTYLYYTDDITKAYLMQRDATLAIAGLGAGTAAPTVYDASEPPANVTITPKPQGFKPRVVFIQSTDDGARKEMIAFHPTSAIYLQNASAAFPAIDEDDTFITTGRKGEKLSFT